MTEPSPKSSKPSKSPEVKCARCGASSSGRFCSECGAPLRTLKCEGCGEEIAPGSRYCAECGLPAGSAAAGGAISSSASGGVERLAKYVGGGALLVLVAFVVGQAFARRSGGGDAATQAPAATPLSATSAPDISSMSPEERASRLFDRVMSYTEQGKTDSAKFFAPMAIQAYEMIGPEDAHAHYDIGVISAATGDAARAKAEADTILAGNPKHLLGLVLAIRAAQMTNDAADVAKFRRRLTAAAPTERATGLKEYGEHSHDIDDALKKAGASPS